MYQNINVNFYILKLTENVKIEIKQFIQGNGNAVFVSITTGNCHRINSVGSKIPHKYFRARKIFTSLRQLYRK